jgi:hypothetical protein
VSEPCIDAHIKNGAGSVPVPVITPLAVMNTNVSEVPERVPVTGVEVPFMATSAPDTVVLSLERIVNAPESTNPMLGPERTVAVKFV